MIKTCGLCLVILGLMSMSGPADSPDFDCQKWNQTTTRSDSELTTAANDGDINAMFENASRHLGRVKPGPNEKYDEMDQAAYWYRAAYYHGAELCAMESLVKMRTIFASFYPEISKDYNSPENKKPVGMLLILKGQREQGLIALIREADMLSSSAQIALHLYYTLPVQGMKKYDPRILAWYVKTAEEGLPRSMTSLAEIYIYGDGVPEDLTKAESLCKKMLQKSEFPDAYRLLATVYFKQNKHDLAQTNFQKAADLGDAKAAYNFAVYMRDQKEYEKALDYFQRCIDIPDSDWGEIQYQALANLAQMKIEGWGTEPDLQTGVKFYQLAADKGQIPEAQYIMGVYYLQGVGVEVSKQKAVDYLTKSAKQGFTQAQELLESLK